MSKTTLIAALFIALFIVGCSTTSKINKQTEQAQKAVATGDYETAFALYDTFIREQQSKNKEISGEIFGEAAKAALQINKYIEAESFFKQAVYKSYADADLYAGMQDVYKKIDNLSKELDVLEFFVEHFKSDARFPHLNKRLFEAYIESENWDKATVVWTSLSEETKTEMKYMEMYFSALKKLENESKADLVAKAILKLNVTNQSALEWNAEKYFWKAEHRYQTVMDAYEKNKTNKQYNIMLKALDGITADFKKSLKYYEMLYKLYPSKQYAKYMANIYTRFQDKNKMEYYLKLSK